MGKLGDRILHATSMFDLMISQNSHSQYFGSLLMIGMGQPSSSRRFILFVRKKTRRAETKPKNTGRVPKCPDQRAQVTNIMKKNVTRWITKLPLSTSQYHWALPKYALRKALRQRPILEFLHWSLNSSVRQQD